jgi:hypothetical protein
MIYINYYLIAARKLFHKYENDKNNYDKMLHLTSGLQLNQKFTLNDLQNYYIMMIASAYQLAVNRASVFLHQEIQSTDIQKIIIARQLVEDILNEQRVNTSISDEYQLQIHLSDLQVIRRNF